MSESGSENVLLTWYRQYVGPPDQTTEIYAGFALFFGGIGLAIVGIALFLWSGTVADTPAFQYVLREIAGATGAAGLPFLLLGVTVLLPVDRRAMYAALVGTFVCLVAVAFFVNAYPVNWNVGGPRDVSGEVVAVYAVGIAAVIAGTGAALVGQHLERVAGKEVEADDADDDGETVTDEQVRRDIDRAMEGAELSWGGVEKTKTKRLKLDTSAIDDVDRRNLDDATAKTTRASGTNVEEAVAGLRHLQGGEKNTASGQGTDDQAAALRELRERQQQEAEREPDGIFDRVRSLFRQE
ncbi:MAG: permease [Salinigranum sp.]